MIHSASLPVEPHLYIQTQLHTVGTYLVTKIIYFNNTIVSSE